jgi:hypothetical protein
VSCRRLHRPDSQGRKARRAAGSAGRQNRACHQPPDGQGAGHRDASVPAVAHQRGDRVKRRQFILLLGGAAAWPLPAQAQESERIRRNGALMAHAESDPEFQTYVVQTGLQRRGGLRSTLLRARSMTRNRADPPNLAGEAMPVARAFNLHPNPVNLAVI